MWVYEQGLGAYLSTCAWRGGQNQAWGELFKNAHFSSDEGGEQLASMRGLGVANGAQRVAQGKAKKALQVWLKRWRGVCVCVCMRSSTHKAFHESLRNFLIKMNTLKNFTHKSLSFIE